MKKFTKNLLKGTGIFLILIILLLVILPFIFKGKIHTIIKEQANANLNAKLEFTDLSLSLFRSFPSLNVQIDELSLTGIDDFKNDTLVKFNYLQTDLNVKSVIFGDAVEVNSIILDKPYVRAIVLKNGKANWDIAKSDSSEIAETDTSSSSSTVKIALRKFKINKGKVIYDDRAGNMKSEIKNLDFLLQGDLSQSKTNLNIKSSIEELNFIMDNISYLKKSRVNFKSEITANMDSMIFVFKDNEFSLNEIMLAFEGNVKMPGDDIATDIKFKSTKTDFKSVLSLVPAIYMKDFNDIKTAGKFNLKGYVKGIYNDKNLPAFAADIKVLNAMFKYPDLPKSVNNINMDINIENKGGSGDINIVDIKKAHAEIAQNPIDANMYVYSTAADVDIKGAVKAKMNLESITDVVPLDSMTIKGLVDADLAMAGKLSSIEKEEYEKFKADGHMELSNFEYTSSDLPKAVLIPTAIMKFSPAHINLKKCDVNIGSSDMHLTGVMDNILPYALKDKTLKARFLFTSNNLNASDLMGDEEQTQAAEETNADTSALTAFEIPANIDFLLNSKLQKVKYDNLEINNLVGDILLKDSKAMFRNVQMNMLDGSMGMNGTYDAKTVKKPKVDFNFNIKNFDIPAAFTAFNTVKQLAPIAKNTNGKFSLNMDFKTDLDYHLNPDYKTLNGSGNFISREIKILKSKALSKLANVTKWKKLSNPSLSDVNLKFKITDGNIEVEPTKMHFGKSEIEFGGSQNLNRDINYKIGMKIPRKELGGAVNEFADNLIAKTGNKISLSDNINLNIFAKGSLDDPKFSLGDSDDKGGGVKEQVKAEVKKEAKEEAKKLIDDADKKSQEIIEQAKVEADKIRAEAKATGEKLVAEADKKGEELKAEAAKQAKDLVDKASNPIAKMGAQKSAKVINEKAEKSAKKMHDEAQKKADKLNEEADKKATAIIKAAEENAAKAKNKADDKVDKS